MAEWTNAPVLKTGVSQGTVGSNPTPAASHSGQKLPIAFRQRLLWRAKSPGTGTLDSI